MTKLDELKDYMEQVKSAYQSGRKKKNILTTSSSERFAGNAAYHGRVQLI